MTFGPTGPNTTESQETEQQASFETTVTAGEALSAFEPVYLDTADSGKAKKALSAGTALQATAYGITQAGISNGATGLVTTRGPITNPAWTWTVGGEVYVGATAESLTQTKPTPGNIQPVGKAIAATIIDVDINTGWTE